MNQTCHTLSIIIPAYNEEKTIAELLQRVLDADLGEGIDRELIVVNDCSTDSTGRIVQSFIAAHPQAPITYLVHDRNQGKGMAVRTGIQAVTGDYVVMQDADLELDPNDFARMLPHLLSGQYRVVYGSRFLAEENSHTYFSYQLGGKFLSVMTNLLYDQRITDEPTCYKMFDAGLLKSIPLDCKGFEFCPEVTAKVSRLGYKIKEVPIRYYPPLDRGGKEAAPERWTEGYRHLAEIPFLEKNRTMKNRTASSKKQPVRKNDTAAKTGITAAWVVKNLLAVVVVAFLLNKLVLGLQPGYNWAYNMLKGNLEVAQHYAQTTTDERYEMKLGLSHVYLRYLKENTPPDAVILLPGKEAFYPEGQERIFSGEPYNKLWATRFLYPRRVIIPSELGVTPWSQKITHVAIVNGIGYEYLGYEVPKKVPHIVLPVHPKP